MKMLKLSLVLMLACSSTFLAQVPLKKKNGKNGNREQRYFKKHEKKLKNPKDIGFTDLAGILTDWGTASLRVLGGSNTLDNIERPFVTIFGASRAAKGSKYYNMAYDIARKLVEKNFAIITGGGPGTMEAANCGARAYETKGTTSVAIGIKGLGTQNECAQERIMLDFFYPRKWLMMEYSSAFVVMPGGVGTMDELFELVTLMSTNRMPVVPIYVIGKKYWKNLRQWLKDAMKEGLVTQKANDLMIFTDEEDEIVDGIVKAVTVKQQPQEPVLPVKVSDSLQTGAII